MGQIPIKSISEHDSGPMAPKKVDALEEKLKGEVEEMPEYDGQIVGTEETECASAIDRLNVGGSLPLLSSELEMIDELLNQMFCRVKIAKTSLGNELMHVLYKKTCFYSQIDGWLLCKGSQENTALEEKTKEELENGAKRPAQRERQFQAISFLRAERTNHPKLGADKDDVPERRSRRKRSRHLRVSKRSFETNNEQRLTREAHEGIRASRDSRRQFRSERESRWEGRSLRQKRVEIRDSRQILTNWSGKLLNSSKFNKDVNK
ncbi:hypothetical protein M5K25_020575 [Dendrobium thyrsiflorum]|uniref:Uncharacterized protein n=1 Tax=Dendrobium thyrsiflorum TaxID=117978 RepID=A0ABD0UH86_DENTH